MMNRTAVLYALTSTLLFGLSTPAAKVLVGSIHPVTLAGLLYCGAGIGVAALRRILPAAVTGAPETALSRTDLPWLAAAICAGGILGPLLLMFGLTRTDAATASLLLTLEGVAQQAKPPDTNGNAKSDQECQMVWPNDRVTDTR
jgi:drug/metabolite transporter (DMT)-like permease